MKNIDVEFGQELCIDNEEIHISTFKEWMIYGKNSRLLIHNNSM